MQYYDYNYYIVVHVICIINIVILKTDALVSCILSKIVENVILHLSAINYLLLLLFIIREQLAQRDDKLYHC